MGSGETRGKRPRTRRTASPGRFGAIIDWKLLHPLRRDQMRRFSWLVIGVLLITAPVFGQSSATDSKTLQDLLQEVRQLRKDLQASISTAQRAQIVLYRMQAQQAVVARMQQRVDNARLI